MKRVIRRNCFETNSSSMHSIVVTKDDVPVTGEEVASRIHWNDFNLRQWDVEEMEYGRHPFRYLKTFEDKVWFTIASYCSYRDDDYCKVFIEDLEGIIREVCPEFEHIIIDAEDSEYYTSKYGWIDHQSSGLLQDFIQTHNITLKDFIFNKKYKVVIDGDEYYIFGSMLDDGIIDKENVVEVYPLDEDGKVTSIE